MIMDSFVVEYNQARKDGVSSEEFAKSKGIRRKTLEQRMRRDDYTFDHVTNCYVKKKVELAATEESSLVPTPKKAAKPKKETSHKGAVYGTGGRSDLNKLREEVKNLEERVERLEQSQPAVCSGADRKELELRKFDSPMKQISYRYHTEVLDALDELCSRYPFYTKHAIINSLLMDAIGRIGK